MPTDTVFKSFERSEIDTTQLDLSQLVGYEIVIFSEQFPGKKLTSKIISSSNKEVTIGRSGGGGLVDDLVSRQNVYAQFDYRGQRVAVRGMVRRTGGGKCKLILESQMVPLLRRQFNRMAIDSTIRMAVVPTSGFSCIKLEKLRWLETRTLNVSGGGALFTHSSQLGESACLLVNMNVEDIAFPPLMTARVRHTNPNETGSYQVGIEFVVKETFRKSIPSGVVSQVPAAALCYSSNARITINEQITSLMQEQGDNNQ
ncbi:MAG: PilZ domain-containing protein [candidate division Zixibacteria bacterium]|nr:PilZ domain-containing protein [candidate division Zixibacteria bacterium]